MSASPGRSSLLIIHNGCGIVVVVVIAISNCGDGRKLLLTSSSDCCLTRQTVSTAWISSWFEQDDWIQMGG